MMKILVLLLCTTFCGCSVFNLDPATEKIKECLGNTAADRLLIKPGTESDEVHMGFHMSQFIQKGNSQWTLKNFTSSGSHIDIIMSSYSKVASKRSNESSIEYFPLSESSPLKRGKKESCSSDQKTSLTAAATTRQMINPSDLIVKKGEESKYETVESYGIRFKYLTPVDYVKQGTESNAVIDNYVDLELIQYKFKNIPARKDQIKKLIYFIYNNDRVGFDENETSFEQVFKLKPHLLKRNKVNYLIHYIIRFGATNFVDMLQFKCGTISSHLADIGEAFEYLVSTKDLDVIAQMISSPKLFKEGDLKRLSAAVQQKYPNLNYLDYLVFEVIKKPCIEFNIALEIMYHSRVPGKFALLKNIVAEELNRTNLSNETLLHQRMVLIPRMFPSEFSSLHPEFKSYFARLAIVFDNFEIFEEIIEQDHQLIAYISQNRFHYIDVTFLHLAVHHSRVNFVEYILDIAPELALFSFEESETALDLAISNDSSNMLQLFNAAGFTFEQTRLVEGRHLNGFQYSFKKRCTKSFEFYLTKIGNKERALSFLLDQFGSRSNILKHCLGTSIAFGSFSIVKLLATELDFDLTAETYQNDKGVKGDARIFVSPFHMYYFMREFENYFPDD